VGCFQGHGMLKAIQQPGECEIPCEDSSRDPPGDGACCGDSRVARASQGLRQGIGWPF
jgi:hypothetical protein